jgi:hypothetical protein
LEREAYGGEGREGFGLMSGVIILIFEGNDFGGGVY